MREEPRILDDQKFYTIQELKEKGYSLYRIDKLVNDGTLIKLNKRCYENTAYRGEESDYYYVHAYIPAGVVCLLSAAVYHELTTYIPDTVDVAIPRKHRVSTLPVHPPVSIHYFTEDRYALGICEIKEGRNAFCVYDAEKTVADIIFYREKVGIEETREVLVAYLRRKDRNLDRLLEYAERLKCGDTLRKYLEVLL